MVVPYWRGKWDLACFAGFVAISHCSLPIPPSFAHCPTSHYSVVHNNDPGFSSCALDHYKVVSGEKSGVWPYREYVSSSARPPHLEINRTNGALSPGLIFLSPAEFDVVSGTELPAALIMTDDGDLVWSSGTAGMSEMVANFRCQRLHDRPVITYWGGNRAGTHGYGAVQVLNGKYETIHSVCPKLNINVPLSLDPKCVCDQHEALITLNNTMLVTVYNITAADLTLIGGPKDAFVIDSLAVEVDIETNKVLFVWSPLQHVSIAQSRLTMGQTGTKVTDPYDWFHINSIDIWGDGYIINSRHTWTTYYVSRSGDIEWQIDGVKGGDFGALPEGAHFVCLGVKAVNVK